MSRLSADHGDFAPDKIGQESQGLQPPGQGGEAGWVNLNLLSSWTSGLEAEQERGLKAGGNMETQGVLGMKEDWFKGEEMGGTAAGRAGVSKEQPTGQVGPIACFWMAHKLRMGFFFYF